MTFTILAISAYFLVAVGFLILMYKEAPKHRAKVGFEHYLVATFWFVWLIWYLVVLLKGE